jgi:hypothetical protein
VAYIDDLRAVLDKVPKPTFAELLKQGDEMVERVHMPPSDWESLYDSISDNPDDEPDDMPDEPDDEER